MSDEVDEMSAASRGSLLEAPMKAKVTQDETGIQWEIKNDGSAEYQKAAQLTREANEREERGRDAMLDAQEPIAWARLSDRGVESVYLLEAVAKDKAAALGGEVVALYAGERRFNAKIASVGDLLDRIKRFIDQTDPWTSQVVDRVYKINTPESRDARKALTEIRKRLDGTEGFGATLAADERLAIDWAARCAAEQTQVAIHKTLRGLLERTK